MPNALALRPTVWLPDGAGAYPGDATDLQREDFGWVLEVVYGLDEQPTMRGEDMVAPGEEGIYPQPYVAHIRSVELAGPVQGIMDTDEDPEVWETNRRASYRTLIDELLALFDPRVRGTLYVTLETSEVRSIHLRPINLVPGPETTPGVRARISIALESDENPYWSDVAGPGSGS